MKRLLHAVLVVLAVGTVLMPAGPSAADDKIKVVATFTVIADMVINIAGDLVDLATIVGPDTDCEEYEPTAADVPKMANARNPAHERPERRFRALASKPDEPGKIRRHQSHRQPWRQGANGLSQNKPNWVEKTLECGNNATNKSGKSRRIGCLGV